MLDWSEAPFAKWFVGGKLNVAYNCVDWHVDTGNGDRVAIHWEGEPVGDSRSITYAELLAEVCRAANALTDLGVRAGNHPLVVLANLSGFDGSPESLRRIQLEYGAEIGRAVVNFDGPIVFCVISRYHGGAFVVFLQCAQREHGSAAMRPIFDFVK